MPQVCNAGDLFESRCFAQDFYDLTKLLQRSPAVRYSLQLLHCHIILVKCPFEREIRDKEVENQHSATILDYISVQDHHFLQTPQKSIFLLSPFLIFSRAHTFDSYSPRA